jgi:hypothetical protein
MWKRARHVAALVSLLAQSPPLMESASRNPIGTAISTNTKAVFIDRVI